MKFWSCEQINRNRILVLEQRVSNEGLGRDEYPNSEKDVRNSFSYRAESLEMRHARHRYHYPANAGTMWTMRIVS